MNILQYFFRDQWVYTPRDWQNQILYSLTDNSQNSEEQKLVGASDEEFPRYPHSKKPHCRLISHNGSSHPLA